MTLWTMALCGTFLAGGVTVAFAQGPALPPEPPTPARAQVGPFSIRPTLIVRDVGFDSNVFNDAQDPESDFTATVGARLDVGARLSRLQGTFSSLYEYVYFQTFETERGSNRGVEGRLDLLGRVRPYGTAGILTSHDRPTAEIDERANRQQSHVETGVSAAVGSRTTMFVAYRHTDAAYAADELFRGVSLADELNGTGDVVAVGADMVLTPLTTLSVHGDRAQDRFEHSPDRDADSSRFGVTATFNPLALISGRASIGVRTFHPRSSQLAPFTGMTAAVAVGYAFGDAMRLQLTVDRDLRYSFERHTPYYVSTGGRMTFTRQLMGNLDGEVFAGAERMAYEARLDAPAVAETDRVRILGGGVGYRVAGPARLAINIDQTTRSSPAPTREYSRRRLYTTLTYGF